MKTALYCLGSLLLIVFLGPIGLVIVIAALVAAIVAKKK